MNLQIGCKSLFVLLQPRLSYAYPYQKNLRVAYIYKNGKIIRSEDLRFG